MLATLDPQPFQAALDQAQATLAKPKHRRKPLGRRRQVRSRALKLRRTPPRRLRSRSPSFVRMRRRASAAVTSANADLAKAQSALTLAQQTYNSDRACSRRAMSRRIKSIATIESRRRSDRSQLGASRPPTGAYCSRRRANADHRKHRFEPTADRARGASGLARRREPRRMPSECRRNRNPSCPGPRSAAQSHRAVITSPVNGTVIARDVSVGETVAASLQTPTLFSIAQDLSKMEVDVAVGENDIGNVKPANRQFHGAGLSGANVPGYRSQVRQNPTVTNNVVTYDTVVLVENSDGSLLPGMTANAAIQIAKAPNASGRSAPSVDVPSGRRGPRTPLRRDGKPGKGRSERPIRISGATVCVGPDHRRRREQRYDAIEGTDLRPSQRETASGSGYDRARQRSASRSNSGRHGDAHAQRSGHPLRRRQHDPRSPARPRVRR